MLAKHPIRKFWAGPSVTRAHLAMNHETNRNMTGSNPLAQQPGVSMEDCAHDCAFILAFLDECDLDVESDGEVRHVECTAFGGSTSSNDTIARPNQQPKRVRKEQTELRQLRTQVKTLEKQLRRAIVDRNSSLNTEEDMGSVWGHIAQQCYRDRSESEAENTRLKAMLEEKYDLARRLQVALQEATIGTDSRKTGK